MLAIKMLTELRKSSDINTDSFNKKTINYKDTIRNR